MPQCLIFFGIGFEVLKEVRIHNAVWVRVWYIVVNVLEEFSGCIFTGRRKMDAACPDRNFGTHQSDCMVP